jgi:hypothetical protein
MRKKHNQSKVAAIADAIVKLVNGSRSPTTLATLARQIPGFSAQVGEPAYEWGTDDGNDRLVVWDGMTKEGFQALMDVVLNARVAICPVPQFAYIVQGYIPLGPNWVSLGLISCAAANFTTTKILVSAPEQMLRQLESHACAAAWGAHRL